MRLFPGRIAVLVTAIVLCLAIPIEGHAETTDVVIRYSDQLPEERRIAGCLTQELTAQGLSTVSNVDNQNPMYIIMLRAALFKGSPSDIRSDTQSRIGIFLDDIFHWPVRPPLLAVSVMVLGGPSTNMSAAIMEHLRSDPRTHRLVEQWKAEESSVRKGSIIMYISREHLDHPNRGLLWCRLYTEQIVKMWREDETRLVRLRHWDPDHRHQALVWGDAITSTIWILTLDPTRGLPMLRRELGNLPEVSRQAWRVTAGDDVVTLLDPETTAALWDPSGPERNRFKDHLPKEIFERFVKSIHAFTPDSDKIPTLISKIAGRLRQ